MRFWLDSANLDDIGWARTCGFVSGITVNQSLIAKEPKQSLVDLFYNTVQAADFLALSFPLVVTDLKAAIDQIDEFANRLGVIGIGCPLYYKVPVSRETLPMIEFLAGKGHSINATAIFTGLQAALAAEAGAKVLSIFVGRINDDTPGYGWKVIEAARQVCGDAEVLAGSIRDKVMVASAIDHGAQIVTTSRRVLEQLADERGTALSVAKFNADLEAWMA